MGKKLGRSCAASHIDAQTHAQERLQLLAEFLGLLETRGSVRGEEVKRLERFFVQVRWLGLDHLDCHDTQGPDVDDGPVFLLFDDLGSHPVWSPDHGGALVLGFGEFGTEAEIS